MPKTPSNDSLMSLSNSKSKMKDSSEHKSGKDDRYLHSSKEKNSLCCKLDFTDQIGKTTTNDNSLGIIPTHKESIQNYHKLLQKALQKGITPLKSQYKSKINRSGYVLSWCEQIQPQKQIFNGVRQIPKSPYKILDAPLLKDDFYTNLLDWSQQDIITVVLDNAVYLWPSKSNEAQKLVQGYISCVKWGKGLILGEQNGRIRIIDAQKRKQKQRYKSHMGRVGVIDVPNNQSYLMASGSKYSEIITWDIRDGQITSKLQGHKQQICGLKWSFDGNYLASGGNDNLVCIWDVRMHRKVGKLDQHRAAVKALAWSPHKRSLLVTGGGSTDKTIKVWNTQTMFCCQSIDTGSQVCNLQFSSSTNELVSAHGYSMNSIVVWNMGSMQKVTTLYGHSYRVLYMARSPDQQSILTGSGDQTLRFWKLFPGRQQPPNNSNLSAKSCQLR